MGNILRVIILFTQTMLAYGVLFLAPNIVNGLPLGYIALSAMLFIRFGITVSPIMVHKASLLLTIACSSIFLIGGLRIALGQEDYLFWPIHAVAGAIAFSIWADHVALFRQRSQRILTLVAILLLSIQIVILLYSIFVFTGARLHFGFGPNMLYRLILLNLGVIIFLVSNSKLKFIILVSSGVITALLVIAIGSRGGLLAFLTLIVVFCFHRFGERVAVVAAGLGCLGAVGAFTVMEELPRLEAFGRITYFDIQNNSEAVRLYAFYEFFNWAKDARLLQLIFGQGFGQEPFTFYPHNLFIELIFSSGVIFGILVSGFAVLGFFQSLRADEPFVFGILFAPFFVATQLSGSLLDNYALFSLLIWRYVVLSPLHRHRTTARTQPL
jgi:hypothetical protein